MTYKGLSTDGVRFELTVRYERTHTFQACALNHSATRPTPFPGRCSRHTPRRAELVHWRVVATRTGWDSNPRYRCRYAGFRDRFLQPLGHLSQGRREGYSVRKAESTHSSGMRWGESWLAYGPESSGFSGPWMTFRQRRTKYSSGWSTRRMIACSASWRMYEARRSGRTWWSTMRLSAGSQ